MQLDMKLEGFAELAAKLRDMPGTLSRRILAASVSAGALVIQQEMKKNAEGMRDTGTLARSIYRKYIPEASGPEKKVYYVAPRKGVKGSKKKLSKRLDAYYAQWVEFGHFSRPAGDAKKISQFATGTRNTLRRKTNRGEWNNKWLANQVQAGNVKWVPAHPFLRPAFDAKKEAAVDAIGQVLGAGVAAVAKGSQ